MQKTAGAPSEDVPLYSRRRTGGEWLEPATLPYPQQAMPRNRAKRDAKNSRSAERGCSSVLPAAEQAANGWSPQPCPPLAGYAAQSRKARCKKQLPSPTRSPPPHTPLKHPAMYLLCIHIPQNSCTIFVILLCRGRLIAANSIYLINIVRLPHVGWAATKIPSRLQIKNKPNVK